MKTKTLLPAVLLAAVFATTTSIAARKTSRSDSSAVENASVRNVANKTPLDVGMDADTVIKSVGKPSEIKKLNSPDSNTQAERWIYRRRVNQTVFQTADSQGTEPALIWAGLHGGVIANIPVATYHLKHLTTYQVTSLLFINGKLELAKQWQEQDESYVN